MLWLDILTILLIGTLVGIEFAVSAFINPIFWQLPQPAQGLAVQLSARLFGRVMPFWYAGSLVLLVAQAILRRHLPGLTLLIVAAALWALVILITVLVLVPINNRLAADATVAAASAPEHHRWDLLHRARVATVALCLVLLLLAVRA